MSTLRTTAHAAVDRLSAVLDAVAHRPSDVNAVLDVTHPLKAAFDSLIDEIDELKREVDSLKRGR